jgi:hypothetical protein
MVGRKPRRTGHYALSFCISCAGFEPYPNIDLAMKCLISENPIGDGKWDFYRPICCSKDNLIFLKCGRARMAQTRRVGMQNESA